MGFLLRNILLALVAAAAFWMATRPMSRLRTPQRGRVPSVASAVLTIPRSGGSRGKTDLNSHRNSLTLVFGNVGQRLCRKKAA